MMTPAYRDECVLSAGEVIGRGATRAGCGRHSHRAGPDDSEVPTLSAAAGEAQELLSTTAQEVPRLAAQGYTSKLIGRQHFLAPSTVNHDLTVVFTKLSVNTHAQAVQAVAEAVQRGLLLLL